MMLANGDSHSYGWKLNKGDTCFVQQVANYFDLPLNNQAWIGSSNQRILRTTKEELEKFTPKFVLIGWTSWEREEWLIDDEWFPINASGLDQLPTPELQSKYKEWILSLSEDHMVQQSRKWYTKIYNFHQELNWMGIPHLFFNAFHPFMLHHTQVREDWGTNFLWPDDPEGTYYLYCHNKKGCNPVDNYYHLNVDAHTIWADTLIKHIEENDLIH